MALSQDRIRAAYEKPHPHVTRVVKALLADDPAWSPDLQGSQKIDAYNAVFRYVSSVSHGSITEIANDAARVWGRMDPGQRRQLAASPLAADTIIAAVAVTDPTLSAKMPTTQHRAQPGAPDTDSAAGGLDAMGRDRWARITGAAGVGASAGSSGYGALSTSYDPSKGLSGLNEQNFGQSPFAAAGLDLQTTLRLGAMGFNQRNILAGVAHARLFGSGPQDERAVRDFATIDRNDPRSAEFIARLQDYQRRLRADEDLRTLEDERRRTQDQNRQRELDREIRQRREVHAREAGVPEHIDRTESAEARDAQRRRKEAVEKRDDVELRLVVRRGADTERSKGDAELTRPCVPPSSAGTRHILDKGIATPNAALAAKL